MLKPRLKSHHHTLLSLAIALSISPSAYAANFTITNGQVVGGQILGGNDTGIVDVGGEINAIGHAVTMSGADAT